jgi:Protein of unknown function (DUF3455)
MFPLYTSAAKSEPIPEISLKGPFMRLAAALLPLFVAGPALADSLPAGFETGDAKEIVRATGVGAQIYICAKGADGALVWSFREPIAALIDASGKTIGRHFAGPTWELADLGAIVGKIAAKAAGASPQDVPLLKLDVVSRSGAGALDGVRYVLRLDTKGGQFAGSCDSEGALHAQPYQATYIFLK